MTNNLAKIAKDLRAFAKRCKDVHYSDSLLISFILSGILSLASISFSDTFDNLSDSQKEAAMDSINEMRQQINYARKDNDKLIKGSSLELVKLMEQGDQVVKSPWGSQQFGFGYTYNSWGTSFKGRGGKQNDIKYRRTNDLTKYVYDPNLHEYGATNLHIQRNKEPDALTINPANVHEPYRPYTPERLDDINVVEAPIFNPSFEKPKEVETYKAPTQNFTISHPVSGPTEVYSNRESQRYPEDELDDGTAIDRTASTADNTVSTANVDWTNNNHAISGYGTSPYYYYDNRDIVRVTGSSFTDGTDSNRLTPGTTNGEGYSTFTVHGNQGNAIQVTGGSSITTRKKFDMLLGNYNVGIFNNGNGTVTDTGSQIEIGGNYNAGVYSAGAGTTTLNRTNINIGGDHNSGVRVSGTGKLTMSLADINTGNGNQKGTINVNGTNGVGIFLDSSNNDILADIAHQEIHANSTTSNGILIGDGSNGTSQASGKTVKATISSTHIYADGTNGTGAGVYVFNTGLQGFAKFHVDAVFSGNGGDTLMAVYNHNTDRETKGTAADIVNNIDFQGSTGPVSGSAWPAIFSTTGDNNVGISLLYGNRVRPAVTNITGQLNSDFNGNKNIGILNNYVAPKLTLNLTLESSANKKIHSTIDNGVLTTRGNDNVMFLNKGYIQDGDIELDALDMHGQRNVGVYLAGNSNPNNPLDKFAINIGMVKPEIKVQGIFGANDGHAMDTTGSVGVYAVSGQRSDISEAAIGYGSASTAPLNDLNLDINIGLNEFADNSTIVWAGEGTKAKVKNTTYANNVTQTGAISDGVRYEAGESKWGYDTHDDVVSTGSRIGYATGYLDAKKLGLYNAGSMGYLSSEIDFEKNVDMVAKEGTAYFANDGGVIKAKATRAGGYNSIIGLANGKHAINGTGSSVVVDGNIVAADNNLLGAANNTNGSLQPWTVSKDLGQTYSNIAGVAIDGGQVEFKNTTKETQVTESKAQNSTDGPNKSLIYGMAAYASGKTQLSSALGSTVIPSKVVFNKAGNGVTVISGENGALFAENNGEIEFNGDIINQNNIGPTVVTTVAGATGVTAGMRNGRGTVFGITNDHTNTTPFFVKRQVEGNTTFDKAGILFNKASNIDMYDGILLSGNKYNVNGLSNGSYGNIIRDYFESDDRGTNETAYDMAKYRGMKFVTAKILKDNGVNLGVINQAEGLIWNLEGNTNTTPSGTQNYLDSIGKNYAGGMAILNDSLSSTPNKTDTNTMIGNRFDSTLINSDLTVKGGTTINIEDVATTKGANNKINDPFNKIKMESTLVTIEGTAAVKGDAANRDLKDIYGASNYQVDNAGLSMANSLYRWDETDISSGHQTSLWRKTNNEESGFINKGKVDISGGRDTNNIAAFNVAYGTVKNLGTDNEGEIKVDHGYGIYATDGSIIVSDGGTSNTAKITVTGKYIAPTTVPTGGSNKARSSENDPTGNNYAIVGISDDRVGYNIDSKNNLVNSIDINVKNTDIEVQGDLAVGIYAENKNNAKADKVTVNYDDVNLAKGIDVQNSGAKSVFARGVGIVVKDNANNIMTTNGELDNGGTLTLNGFDGSFGGANDRTTNNILTGKNGIGIYAESTDVKLLSDKFTIQTEDNGVGVWMTDDSNFGNLGNKGSGKVLQYNYYGAKDKNAFAMAFTGTRPNVNTIANNYIDIKFNNKNDATNVNLVNESSRTGTNKGIAGILVNTDGANDVVNNYGNIEEDKSSVTNLRAYGAVVNKGTFVNYGDIKLNDSLMPNQASDVTSADMKKVNVGIFANRENGLATTIENHGDITIGKDANSDKNIGSWAIYGYNIKTGAKPDGTDSVITINRNSYGIYSGDGNVDIQKTKLKVGNDKVLGHVMHTWTDDAGTVHNIDRQNGNYAQSKDLLSGLDKPRKLDNAIGIYIDKGASNTPRKLNLSADMDIDRFSYGIVLAEKNGGAQTDVTIGTPTDAPTIRLAYSTNNNLGGHVKSTAPTKVPKVIADEVLEQGNAVYYYSADNNSRATSYANVTMDGDYNTAYYTKGSVANYGTIDLRSKYDVDNHNVDLGYGNVGIFSANPDLPSVNYGTITTSMSDTGNMRYSAAMAAGRNYYKNVLNTNGKYENKYDRTEEQGYIVNEGNIVVKENAGIGMFATGSRSRAINKGTIKLEGEESIGMYLDQGAIGENYGTITGNQRNLKGVVAINGGYIKNYGTISVTGTGSNGIVTDGSKFIVDANGNPTEVLESTDPRYNTSAATTAVQNNGGNGGKDLYGGSESSLEEGTSGNPKTTGVGTTITMPDVAPLTTISVDGVNTPIFTVDTNAPAASVANPNGWGDKISITSSIQTGGTRIIDLSELDGWGNKMWNNYQTDQLSEVTSVGMYVDTSGVRYTNPINGLNNLSKLAKVNLYFGPEATQYTNAKAIRLGNQLIKPFNDALNNLPGGAVVNPLSASLTWQVAAKLDDNNQLTDVYMSKVPYHSFAFDDDTSLVNFTNNLDNVYEIVDLHTNEKEIFNKLNSLGNGEGHILAQAFDQMRAHIYGGIQQRTVATEKIFDSQVSGVMSSNGMVGNPSKDSTKYKAFGERGEYKTDTKGIPDYENYAGGFVAVHEGESIYKGEKHGWYTGVVDNNFSFKDIARSHENQAMIKGGLFKTTPFDVNGEFTWTIAGEGYFGRTDTNRRFWVVDKQYDAEAHYYTYGVALKNELAKSFRLSEGFAIKPHVGIDLEYGRYSSFHEDGTMSLDVKGNDYHSIKPNLGVDFTYKQPVFKKSMFVASLGLGYEKELGRVNDVTNEARIQGAWTDYFSIRGDKENKKGNYKADLNLGIDNGRLGFTVNAGYDSTGKNFRGGAGLRFIF